MSEFPACPKCKSEYVYPSDGLLICPECFYELNPENKETIEIHFGFSRGKNGRFVVGPVNARIRIIIANYDLSLY